MKKLNIIHIKVIMIMIRFQHILVLKMKILKKLNQNNIMNHLLVIILYITLKTILKITLKIIK